MYANDISTINNDLYKLQMSQFDGDINKWESWKYSLLCGLDNLAIADILTDPGFKANPAIIAGVRNLLNQKCPTWLSRFKNLPKESATTLKIPVKSGSSSSSTASRAVPASNPPPASGSQQR